MYGSTLWDTPSLTDHHLSRALGARHHVLFVETPATLIQPLRAGLTRAGVRRLFALGRRQLRRDGAVDVLRVVSLPPKSRPWAQRLSAPWIRRQLRAAVRRAGMHPTIAIGARPFTVDSAPGPRPFVVALVKDWLQAGGHLTGLDAGALRERELRFWRSADLVCAVSPRLQARLAEDGIDSVLLRHGSSAASDAGPSSGPVVEELADLPRPLLGSVGRIDGRWAFDALEDLARAHPMGSLVLVGPLSPLLPRAAFERLLALPNVHHFGPVDGDRIASWLDALDCCLVPYKEDEWQQYASPLKVWDYFRAGHPIVATGSPALGDFPAGLIHFASSPDDLVTLVGEALAEDPASGLRRRRYASENTWDDRAGQLMALVAQRREGRRVGDAG